MAFSGSWRSTLYTLAPVEADRPPLWGGAFEPGAVIQPFSDPVLFESAHVREIESPGFLLDADTGLQIAPGELTVFHRLAPPGPRTGAALAPFAIGRIISGMFRAERRGDQPGVADRVCYEAQAVLGCAFGVARRDVPAGASLGDVEDIQTLAVRLGMLDEAGIAETYGSPPYAPGVGPNLPASPVSAGAIPGLAEPVGGMASPVEASGQRFDRLAGCDDAAGQGCAGGARLEGLDLTPLHPRTISVGWGWESPKLATSGAFQRIVGGRAETLFAVDCRQPPGWAWDFDVSWLLGEIAPGSENGERSATFWIGVWVTSDKDRPLDFPGGGPRLMLPPANQPPGTRQRWVAEQSAVMGYWRLVGD